MPVSQSVSQSISLVKKRGIKHIRKCYPFGGRATNKNDQLDLLIQLNLTYLKNADEDEQVFFLFSLHMNLYKGYLSRLNVRQNSEI